MKRINRYTVKLVKESSGLYNVDENSINTPEALRNIINEVFDLENEVVEKFGIIAVTTKNKVCGMHILTSGTLNASIVHPREVFQAAPLHPCNGIFLFHNHPSGDCTPSREDIELTKRMSEAGKIMGIQILDHIIVSHSGYLSMKESGYL